MSTRRTFVVLAASVLLAGCQTLGLAGPPAAEEEARREGFCAEYFGACVALGLGAIATAVVLASNHGGFSRD